MTPPMIARRLGVEPAKVIGWINSGELSAINIAKKRHGRPRWRIRDSAFETFISGRTKRLPEKSQPRRSRKREQPFEFV